MMSGRMVSLIRTVTKMVIMQISAPPAVVANIKRQITNWTVADCLIMAVTLVAGLE